MKPIRAWKFLTEGRRLQYRDGRPVEVGVTLTVDGDPILCRHGIHASQRAIDALQYAPGPHVAFVKCAGRIAEGDDKIACTELTPIAIIDATDLLRAFARQCALDVIHLWDAPEIVRQYLETGDRRLRDAAMDTAWDGAASAAWAAARAAAWAAAGAASGDTAWAAARAASMAAAWAASWAAARSAAMDRQNKRLTKMLRAAKGERICIQTLLKNRLATR